jgi:hypothetical protein
LYVFLPTRSRSEDIFVNSRVEVVTT